MGDSTTDKVASAYVLWSVQDALLQSYRSFFLAFQCFLAAVIAGVASDVTLTTECEFSLGLAAAWGGWVLGIAVWGLGITITRHRALDVAGAQAIILALEGDETLPSPMVAFKKWQATTGTRSALGHPYHVPVGAPELDGKLFLRSNDPTLRKLCHSTTRRIMDTYMPSLMAIVWVALLAGLLSLTCWANEIEIAATGLMLAFVAALLMLHRMNPARHSK